jgi:formate--tetrahydrofolate ligase
MGLIEKIEAISTRIYGVDFAPTAVKELAKLTKLGFGSMPVYMAKTQYSLTDDPIKRGLPKGFRIAVKNAKLLAGAEFVVAYISEMMTMPGLGKIPSAEKIDVYSTRKISGLF